MDGTFTIPWLWSRKDGGLVGSHVPRLAKRLASQRGSRAGVVLSRLLAEAIFSGVKTPQKRMMPPNNEEIMV